MSGLLALLAGQNLAHPDESAAEPSSAQPVRRIYLDEFRPQSSLKVPEHILTCSKFPCVNVHSHPGQLSSEELAEMVRVMDESNTAVSVSLDGGFDGAKFADHAYQLEQSYPGRFVVFQRMDYVGDGRRDDPSTWAVHHPGFGQKMADQLTEAVRQGACGMKVWKDLGLYLKDLDGHLIKVDDPRFDPVWERAGELKIPIVWHCADPRAFFQPTTVRNERWEELSRHPEWSFYGPGFPAFEEIIAARNRVIARHPETTFICAHMAEEAEDLALLGTLLDRYPNMNVEIAARISELGRQPYSARKFLIKYADRVLFGTDGVPPITELIPHYRMLETWDEYFPYEDNPFPPQGLWNIYGLGLPDDVLKKIYNENASRLIPTVAEKVKKYELLRSRQARREN
jgi:predicted TIM-barrel fold metal-dependent hydrolase